MQYKTNLRYLLVDLSLIQTTDPIPLQVSIAIQTSEWSGQLREIEIFKSKCWVIQDKTKTLMLQKK